MMPNELPIDRHVDLEEDVKPEDCPKCNKGFLEYERLVGVSGSYADLMPCIISKCASCGYRSREYL